MPGVVDHISAAIFRSLPFFGLVVDNDHAEILARVYVDHRRTEAVNSMAEMLAAVPLLEWRSDDTESTKVAVMRILTVHLDQMGLVELALSLS
jgi:hypothetical protein